MFTAQDFYDRLAANPSFLRDVPAGPFRDLHRDMLFALEAQFRPRLTLVATPTLVATLMRDSVRFLIDAGWTDRLAEGEASALAGLSDPTEIQKYVAQERLQYEEVHDHAVDQCRLMAAVNDPHATQDDRDEGERHEKEVAELLTDQLDPADRQKFMHGFMTTETLVYIVFGTY